MGTVKYTGPVASFHCPTNAEIRSLKVHFSPKQEGIGDPSPENVRPIVGWDGLTTHRTGKNLFNVNRTEGSPNPTDISNSTSPRIMDCIHYFVGLQAENYYYKNYTIATVLNGTITVTNKNNNSYGVGFPVCVKSNTTYTLSFTAQNAMVSFGYYDNEWHYLSASTGSTSGNPRTITTPEKTCYMVIVFRAPQSETATYTYSNIQLELGSTATSYESYQGTTTDYEFGVLGKNKFNKNDSEKIISGVQVLSAGKIGGSSTSTTIFVPCQPNITYTISKLATARAAISYATTNTLPQINDSVYGYQNIANQSTATITTGDNAKWLCVYITNTTYDSTSVQDILDSLQVELGSIATAYEPYDPNHTVYGGWVDLISGEVCQEWTEPLTLGEPYYYGGNVCFGYTYPSKYTPYPSNLPSKRILSALNKSTFSINTRNYFIFGYDSTFEKTDGNGNLNPEWTNWYNSLETKPTISLQLYEPITYSLAPTQLQTFLGQNNVWSNADYVEVEYDLHEIQNILARKQFIMANQPHIVKSAAVPLQNFVTDMTAPLKECKVYFSPVQEGSGDPSPDNVRPINGWTGVEVYQSREDTSNFITFHIDWTDEAGTVYGGYVDLVTWEVVAEYVQRIYDGSSDESWALSGNDTYVCNQMDARNDIRNIRPICDKFYMETTYGTNYRIRPIGNKIYANTVAEWREWLMQNPIQVVYELAEPIHYSLTPTQLKTLRGTNNIWASNNGGNIEMAYWSH